MHGETMKKVRRNV